MSKKKTSPDVPQGYILVKQDVKKGGKVPIDRGSSDLDIKVIKKTLPVWDKSQGK